MEFKQVIGSRRSIRFYQPWRPVEREKIQTILEAARLASRAVNAAFCKAIVVYRNELTEDQINRLKQPTTTAQLDMAPVWIMWFADMGSIDDAINRGTLKELVSMGALTPSHGWSHRYVDEVIVPQVLRPIASDPATAAALIMMEASLAMNQGLLAAVDEGLGTQLTAVDRAAVKEITGHPDNWVLMWAQLVGYPAESADAGGQRPREPFEMDFFENRYGTPFKRDEKVVERLTAEGMIQPPMPHPWRPDELRALSRMFGLPE